MALVRSINRKGGELTLLHFGANFSHKQSHFLFRLPIYQGAHTHAFREQEWETYYSIKINQVQR